MDQVSWDDRFCQLQLFKAKYGHCHVPRGYIDNPQLAQWCSTQRIQYKLMTEKKRTAMTEEHANLLEAEGFIRDVFPGLKQDDEIVGINDEMKVDEMNGINAIDLTPTNMMTTEENALVTTSSVDRALSGNPLVNGNFSSPHHMTFGTGEILKDEERVCHELPPVLPPPEVQVNEFSFTSV